MDDEETRYPGASTEMGKKMMEFFHHLKKVLMNLMPYPKSSYSQCGEDLIIDFILKEAGLEKITYLDIGTHDPIIMNNTYKFYRQGGSGVCVEPNPKLFKKLKRYRPRDICLNAGVSSTNQDNADFFLIKNDTLSTLIKENAENLIENSGEAVDDVIRIPILSIDDAMGILPECPIIVSIDTEGMDYEIIQGIDFNRYRPFVFCIETLTYEKVKTGRKMNEIIDFMDTCEYFNYADTFINTIFVDRLSSLSKK